MDATRQHALLSYILEGMSPEEQQKALVAFSSLAQGDPNTLPVQLALFMKGAAKAMQEAGVVITSEQKEAPALIEESFARGLIKQEELQRSLSDGLGKFLPQVEKINSEMATVPDSIQTLKKHAERAETAATEALSTARGMSGKILGFSTILMLAVIFSLAAGVFIDEGLRHWIGTRSFFDNLEPLPWLGAGFLMGCIVMFIKRRVFP